MVTVLFDTELMRTRRPEKFERVVRETLGAIYGRRADSVLAKHDENYMPREVADTLKKQGHWQGEANAAPKTQ